MHNHTHDQIEDYIAGRLEGAALEQFERDMKTDSGLAAEVALYRDMAVALAPHTEAALRENLNMLGKKFAPPETTERTGRAGWIAALTILALFSGWLIWKTVSKEAVAPASPPKTSEPVVEKTSPQENTTPVNESPTIQNQDTNTARNKPALIAADFRPNPRLEELYRNQYRSNDFRFRVAQPAADANLTLKNGQIDFRLSGTVETSDKEMQTPFRVLLFSNKPKDYNSFHFLFARFLTFENQGEAYAFRVEERLRLNPGLYYYLIEAKDSGMPYQVGKIKVVE